jgi:carotenoid cleavage dioxygenase
VPNIPFDGEGHIGVFRFANGHVGLPEPLHPHAAVQGAGGGARSAVRHVSQSLYRRPARQGRLARHRQHGRDVPPRQAHGLQGRQPAVILDPDTLDTLDDYYTFGGKLTSLTFTAHPKIDSETGDLYAFGYEARGEASDDVALIHIDRHGRLLRETWIKVPYVGMIHDFAVTQKHIALLVVPMATDVPAMKQGRVHFSWDPALPTWLGILRRDGDGSDLRWFKGPERCATHTMGCFSEVSAFTSTWTWD